jgi:hypothetical protein
VSLVVSPSVGCGCALDYQSVLSRCLPRCCSCAPLLVLRAVLLQLPAAFVCLFAIGARSGLRGGSSATASCSLCQAGAASRHLVHSTPLPAVGASYAQTCDFTVSMQLFSTMLVFVQYQSTKMLHGASESALCGQLGMRCFAASSRLAVAERCF